MKDPLVEIAFIIKTAREQAGLSIKELASESRVSARHIENIEEVKREELPEEAYLTGFFNKLLKALKIENAAEIVSRFRQEEGNFVVQSLVNNNDPEQDAATGGTSYFEIYHLYILLGVLVLLLSWFVITSANKDNEGSSKNKTVKEKIQRSQAPSYSKEVVKHEPEENKVLEIQKDEQRYVYRNTYTAGKGDKAITVRVKEIAWVQIIGMDDRNILYEGDVFPASEPNQFKFKDDDGFIIATGNAGAFAVDTGDGFKPIGASGQLLKWYYPKSIKRKFERSLRKKPIAKYKEQELVRM